MPKRVVKDTSASTSRFGRYIAEPFEIGYARTIGNSIRRVLLSSLEGIAISSVRLEGASHEFTSLPGISEDVTTIILALKKVLAKSYTREPKTVSIRRKGPCKVTAADLADNSIEILNPHLEIATVNSDGIFELDAHFSSGRGFCPAEWDGHNGKQQEIGVIPLDRAYSPVVRVNFDVENTRVGQHTDYEKLTIEITTDGRVDPDEALVTASAILRHHLDVFVDFKKDIIEGSDDLRYGSELGDDLKTKLNMNVNEIELSVRAANCLNNANIQTVGELVMKTEADMLKYRNFGKKSLNEIMAKLEEMGLFLGFKFDPSLMEKK